MATLERVVFDDLEPITIPYSIGGKDYILKEATGDAGTKWHNAITKCIKSNSQSGLTTADGVAETESLLVSLCLSDPQGRQVSIKEIKSWPYRIQKALFNKAKEISDLGEDEQTEEQLEEKIKQLQDKLDRKRAKISPLANGSPSVES